jgi:hypothetical protein
MKHITSFLLRLDHRHNLPNWLRSRPEQRYINRGRQSHTVSNDSRVRHPAPIFSNRMISALHQVKEPLPVFLQDLGGETQEDHHRRLHHAGTGPHYHMDSSVDGMSSKKTPLFC